jgi:hypothetical protein
VNRWAAARRVAALAAVGLVLGAGPAAADAAAPGDFSSRVTSVEPDPGGFSIDTAGGDSFLELSVDDGVEVVVLGYEGEPYLRFSPDGTVEQNLNSPATFINDDRYGANDLAPDRLQGADVTALEPDWEQVASNGTFAWHDHRTHEMRPDSPVPRGESYEWSAPVLLEVEGETVEVFGEITFEDSVSPLPWFAVALLAAIALGGWGGRLPDVVPGVAVAVVAGAATAVAWIGYSGQPPGTGASIVPTVVGVVALGLGIVAAVVDRLRAVALLAGGVFLATWGVFRLAVLSNPVLPTTVPFGFERLVTALSLGVGVGAVVVAFRSGALTTALLPAVDE